MIQIHKEVVGSTLTLKAINLETCEVIKEESFDFTGKSVKAARLAALTEFMLDQTLNDVNPDFSLISDDFVFTDLVDYQDLKPGHEVKDQNWF